MMHGMIWFVLLFAIALLIYMVNEAFQNRIIEHRFCLEAYPAGVDACTFFFISDIHRRKIKPALVDAAAGAAQFVVIGGDLLERGVPAGRIEANLKLLKKIGPVFFVWGNNDYEMDEQKLESLFSHLGIHTLRNSTYYFSLKGKGRIALIGVDDLSKEQENLDEALESVHADDFRILVSHNPKMVHQLNEMDHIHLMLSGHTHGGQIHLPGYSPFKHGGVKKTGSMIHLISNGYGTTVVPMRLGAKPETHLITIKNVRNCG